MKLQRYIRSVKFLFAINAQMLKIQKEMNNNRLSGKICETQAKEVKNTQNDKSCTSS